MEQSVYCAFPVGYGFEPQAFHSIRNISRRGRLRASWSGISYTAMTFNVLWCDALNRRAEGNYTHFAMHHSDIGAEDWWVDKLIDEMDRVGADVLSCVVPIKDHCGVTSTAVDWGNRISRRLTMKQIKELPETFSAKDIGRPLLVNTGLWVCRFDAPWVEEVCFTFDDSISKIDGRFVPSYYPEDWNFSRWANERGLKLFATSKLRLEHVGRTSFRSTEVWGHATDLYGNGDALAHQRDGIADILKRHDTDKQAKGIHDYGEVYAQALEPIRDTALNVLEIGVLRGGSMAAWSEFFPNAKIYGLDIQPTEEARRVCAKIGGALYAADQSDHAKMEQFARDNPATFDLIVDDGSHNPLDQMRTRMLLWDCLKPGGVMAIEDIGSDEVAKWCVATGGVVHDRRKPTDKVNDNRIAIFHKPR